MAHSGDFWRATSLIFFLRKDLGQIQNRTSRITISAPEKDPVARVPARQIKDAKQNTVADGPE
jgi:hypothetical protein